MNRGLTILFLLSGLHISCKDPPGTAQRVRPPNQDEIPAATAVPAATVTTGFAIGSMRDSTDVPAFRIGTFPITVAQFRECVRAGACTTPASKSPACTGPSAGVLLIEQATYLDDPTRDSVPVTCVTPSQATGYCAWQQGSLPTINQWVLAARGSTVQRFSWGNDSPTCAQHPLGSTALSAADHCCDGACSDSERFAIGHHAAGAAASGIQDVLLTPGELLAVTRSTAVAACNGEAPGACVIRGIAPGAIDGALPVADDESPSSELPVYGFRCAWSN